MLEEGGASATTAKYGQDGQHVKGQTIELLLILYLIIMDYKMKARPLLQD